MKVIAFYLPQFHEIPENNEWWGKGFTEWTTLKKATPLFRDHYQPRIPLNENYYNLLDPQIMEWQCQIARNHGIYGFCFYHYWFDGHLLLQKPVEQYLDDKECDLPFCICWANEHWTRAWESKKNQVLIAQRYGGEKEWEEHFRYLEPFLKDSRYIRINGKSLIVIYRPELIDCLNDMLDCWKKLAREEGIGELSFAYQYVNYDLDKSKDDSRFDYAIEYQPVYASAYMGLESGGKKKIVKEKIKLFFEKHLNIILDFNSVKRLLKDGPQKVSYDETWKYILSHKPQSNKHLPGAFVDWDNTPRKGKNGTVFVGGNPEKFEGYFKLLINKARNEYKKDYIFIFAWNEWSEGGYLEPDKRYRYGYLESIRKALAETNELPR